MSDKFFHMDFDKPLFDLEGLKSNASKERLETIRKAVARTNGNKAARKRAAAKLTLEDRDAIDDPAGAIAKKAAAGDESAVANLICLFGSAGAHKLINKFKTEKKNEL